ncbi:MAG: type II secretion system protein [Patescibacteria group bacterium]
MRHRNQKGFTLLEIMLVLGILGILAAVVMVAINPNKQLDETKDVSRHSSVREIENAAIQYIIDGNSFAGVPASKALAQDICRAGGVGCYDLSVLTPTYLVSIPVDSEETDVNFSGYRIYMLGSFLKVCSPRVDVDCGS